MALWARVASLWRNLVHGDRFERDLNEEVRATYDLLVDERVRAGASAGDARRLAALALGGVEGVKQQVRENRTGASVDAFLQDARYATRSLASRPLVSGAAVVSLALGIGVNTAIFSVFERLILRRLLVPAANVQMLLGALAVVLTVTLAAAALPARRAASVNPAQTLRAE
jgi:hypothetical protein